MLKADAAVCSAFEAGDAKALGGMLDATFILTSSRGEVTDRAQDLDEVARREPYCDLFCAITTRPCFNVDHFLRPLYEDDVQEQEVGNLRLELDF